ncbi:MAG TPA: hypothetical protein VFM37_08355 [Pseudonocardiaceae bacterium]|nr:hypothetical protein [Pseudonocardiaceae bacterium]
MPVNMPTAHDVRKARKQATTAVAGALEQARTPLYAALGAGSVASEKVVSYARKARGEAYGQADTAQARVHDLQVKLTELQARLNHLPAQLRTRLAELTDELSALRGRLDAAELRELRDAYRRTTRELYDRLAVRGERVYGELSTRPQVRRTVDRVEHAADNAELRVEKFVEEARVVAEDLLSRVSGRTRSVGEKAAHRTEAAATEVAEAVIEAGDEVASSTRSVTRKAAYRTQPAKPADSAKPARAAARATRTSKPATRRTGTGSTSKA